MFSGGSAILWFFVWKLTISNSPDSDAFITETEKKYLKEVTKSGEITTEKVT